jgi:hypothetical protein
MAKSYKRIRRSEYLKTWPIHKQMEAMQDKDNGDSTKWDRMQADFAAIRAQHPKPGE